MTALPPLYRDQRKIDADHLRLLVLFHYIGAALSGVGLLFVFGHYSFLRFVLSHTRPAAGHAHGPAPDEVFKILIWFYLVFALWFLLSGISDLISARCIRARRHRVFSLLVAGLNLVHTPAGTMLGVFTFVVLLRDSVREVYEGPAPTGAGQPPREASAPLVSTSTPNSMSDIPPSIPQPPPIPSTPVENRGDATGGIIPYKNPHALTAYYLGVFSIFPVLGFFFGVAAIVLGVSGLRQKKRNPVIRGSVHAWIGIVCGSLSVAAHVLLVVLLLVAALTRH
jgi:hypothetical protein